MEYDITFPKNLYELFDHNKNLFNASKYLDELG